ncbi:MAG: DUF885 family protein [Blautia faecicola]
MEGWATYAESFAYRYYQPDSTDGQFAWLNRSLNLCIMSLLDTGIHYNGWNQARCATFLSQLGVTDTAIQTGNLSGDRGRSCQLSEVLPRLPAVS